ncbi:hypothetical protein RF039_24605, partial [Enterobacter sichuanensis]|nr:hypothetical protein [Enterobacter sichuanensis]
VFAGKKSAQIREILISESAWEEMTCLFAPSLEQQASIVSDYWLLKYHGLKNNEHLFEYRDFNQNETIYYLLQKYQAILRGFPG